MADAQLKPEKMTSAEFLAWSIDQPGGRRFELARGEVIQMASERVRHALTKGSVYRAFGDAIARSGLKCVVFPDGMAVRVDDETVYEPDAAVRCGAPLDDDAVVYDDPVVVVEVSSPSTAARDEMIKLGDYFQLPSVQHYLILEPEKHRLTHHARQGDGTILTRILTEGQLTLDPPGIAVDIADLFP